jgi:hypothetical protein
MCFKKCINAFACSDKVMSFYYLFKFFSVQR